jgi:hypothetical protein
VGRRQRLEELRRDRGAVLDAYVGMTAEALEGLTAEGRNKLYKILKFRVVVRDDGTPEVSGVFCGALGVPEYRAFGKRNTMPMSFQTTKRFDVYFHALINEGGCEQLEIAKAPG